MTKIFETDGRFAAETPYNKDFIAAVKQIPGRRWDAEQKVWTVSAEQESALRTLVVEFFGEEEEPVVNEGPKMLADFPTLEAYAKYLDSAILAHAQRGGPLGALNVVFHPLFGEVEGQAPVGFRVQVFVAGSFDPGVALREVLRSGSYKHIAPYFQAA